MPLCSGSEGWDRCVELCYQKRVAYEIHLQVLQACPSMSLLRKTSNTGRHSTPGARTQFVQQVVKSAERAPKGSRIDDESETTTVGYRGNYQVYEGSGDENPTTEGEEEEPSASDDNEEDLREGSRTERSGAGLQMQGSTSKVLFSVETVLDSNCILETRSYPSHKFET